MGMVLVLVLVLGTPGRHSMEIMAVEIICNINLIANKVNITNVNMIAEIEAMANIDGIMMMTN
jgi:hypothetical protein